MSFGCVYNATVEITSQIRRHEEFTRNDRIKIQVGELLDFVITNELIIPEETSNFDLFKQARDELQILDDSQQFLS